MFDRRSILLTTSAGLLGLPGGAAPNETDKAVDVRSAIRAFAEAYNGGATAALFGSLAAPELTLQTCDGTFDLNRVGPAAVANALHRARNALGPVDEEVMAGSYLALSEFHAIWLARLGSGKGAGLIPIRFRFSPQAPERIAQIDMTGDFEGLPPVAMTTVKAGANGSSDVQQAYDRLAAAGGGVLFFAPGFHRLNLELHSRLVTLAGAGAGVTVLSPADPGSPILRATYRSGVWDEVAIRDLELRGAGTEESRGFEAGHSSYANEDEYAGRTMFRRVRFDRLGKCISRPNGQIGLRIEACQFEEADYHFHSRSGHNMHSGVVFVRDTHMQRARKAVFFIDSPVVGSGQIVFDNCLFEGNRGFVFYCRALAGLEGVPGLIVRSSWNEMNSDAGSVTIDAVAERPCFGHFADAPQVLFEDTPLGNLVLRNSKVATRWSALDQIRMVDSDPSSVVEHHHARCFGGKNPAGLVVSLAATFQSNMGATPTFRLVSRTNVIRADPAHARLVELYANPVTLIGSSSRETSPRSGGALPTQGVVQELRILAGETLFLPPVSIPGNRWLVWSHVLRVMSGGPLRVEVTGSRGISEPIQIGAGDWMTLGGVTFVETPAIETSIRHSCSGDTIVQFAASNLVAFQTEQQAIEFVNSRSIMA